MSFGQGQELPHWYVVRTKPKRENDAANNLTAWKVEVFNPKIIERRVNQFTNQPTYLSKPLFPGYIFARFEVDRMLHKICFTRGVSNVVCFGNVPCPINDEVIRLIQSHVDEDGFVKIGTKLKPGDKVSIRSGPFKGLIGVLEREMKDSERLMLLMNTINYQGRIIIGREDLEKVV
ncbi:MAG TPA: transcription termination/antitermination NusG family protein [Pyrinomonadaceae bacterium]|jgi:transcriptional antiterminator RfaH